MAGDGGGRLGSQQTCQIKLVPLTIAGYQALTGDNTTQRSQNISKYHDPCDAVARHCQSITHCHSHTTWPGLTLTKFNAEVWVVSGGRGWARRPEPDREAIRGHHNTTHIQ